MGVDVGMGGVGYARHIKKPGGEGGGGGIRIKESIATFCGRCPACVG